ncbi:iron complex outermembrane receptor protein [Mucilaginibacter yixingensis]|uniref:Iron complex outermembrane receptor protein n=1 Tax=Mucilaginibacter yixingensis TaxID=1295612 RepID=A0A2T5J878_9SPHI|nr:TonB-dependent receptor [Mucilaginibacter yixingensis]PTQ95668.1 iron complex outermembrane receptor protein [Mucilaginibacter yixingensis]
MKSTCTTFVAILLSAGFARAQQPDTSKHIFSLGEVTIKGHRDTLKSNHLDAAAISKFNRLDVSHALNLLPGVTLSAVGQRNESAVNVRGFDLRQVPVYLDGMPLYVPYDGYVDLARYTTFNLSEIQVAKGYSSVLYGPNAEGGAINLITRRPVNAFEANAVAGWLSGGYRLNTNIGSKLGKFYYQVSASQLKQNWYPMSGSFTPVKNEDGGHRDNSYRNDVGVSGKVGFTPDSTQEYAVGYSYQHGQKGTPVYAGSDPLNSLFKSPRYWKWPFWNTQSLYFLSNNKFGSNNKLSTRWYYNKFDNETDSYDDVTYTTISKPYAFQSIYNDYTLGASLVFENTSIKKNNFSIAAHYKEDVHHEHNISQPTLRDADNNYTVGAEDTYHLTPALKVNAGVSFMRRSNDGAQSYNSSTKTVFDQPSGSNNAWNLQGLVQYDLDATNAISFSVARKTRFATIKDRYSYKLGTAIPNPDLKAEDALNYDLTYHGSANGKVFYEVSGFYSKINNSIQTVNNVFFDATTNTNLAQVQNVGKAEYYGAEAGIGYQPIKQLRLDANYTHLVRNNLSSPTVYFTDVPKDKVFASAEYHPLNKLYVLASEEYNSSRYSTSYGTTVGGFYLTNAKAHLVLQKGFSVEAGVNNIFDRNYQLTEGYPEVGRNYFANIIFNY